MTPPSEPAPRISEAIHVHGPGRAGVSLGAIFQTAGHRVVGLSGGSVSGANEAREILGPRVVWTNAPPASFSAGTLLVLGVPDDRLVAAAQELAERPAPKSGLACHLSGAIGRSVLEPLAHAGWGLGAWHPLCSFPSRRPSATDLEGAAVAVEAASPERERLFELAASVRGEAFDLEPSGRALYHCAAALMGNNVLAILRAATTASSLAGMPPTLALHSMVHLAVGALENARRVGPARALSGPLVRGDVATLRSHVTALERSLPETRRLYLELMRGLLPLCAEREDHAKVERVARWLDEVGS